jgi:dienelactone hydrolase
MRIFNLLPGLGRIQCATLILAGEDDPILPMEDSEDIARAIPSHLVRFERFSNAGHGVFRDEPDRGFKSFATSLRADHATALLIEQPSSTQQEFVSQTVNLPLRFFFACLAAHCFNSALCCSALAAARGAFPVARNLRARRALLWHSYINTVSTYTYVRTKHLRQVPTSIAIRWREGVKSKS